MHGAHILLVEDDVAIATVIRVALEGEGARLDTVTTLAARNAALARQHFDVIVTDVILPDGNGLTDLAAQLDGNLHTIPVIVLSAQNTLDTAVRAEAEGAFDYLPKPFDLDELIATLRSALKGGALSTALDDDRMAAHADEGLPIIGRDPAMQMVYRTLARVAPTDLSVLILGESGTGKELVAEAIHRASMRSRHPFIAVNMAAIPRELIESELFGHEKGSFTGAHARAIGRFEQAVGGTLFLDEIGDMPLEAQTRLLRVLQSGEYSPIGSARVARADVRILAATNQDLTELVRAGRFREDLYYRLNVIPIQLPPLRKRKSDIPLLARHFLEHGVTIGVPQKSISGEALAALGRHDWPGNVRELSNAMQRLALLTRGHEIGAPDVRRLLADLPASSPDGADAQSPADLLAAAVRQWVDGEPAQDAASRGALYDATMSIIEEEMIERMVERHGGNQLKAAAALGINRNTLRIKRRQP